ncbi:MAG: hypothetical protein RLN90_00545 [Balneolaceae bacterium]
MRVIRKFSVLIGFILVLSCEHELDSTWQPNLDPNPLPEIYKNAGIKSYVQFEQVEDSIVRGDSVNFDSNGNKISRMHLWDPFGSKTWYEYDSLNRLTRYYHRSDIVAEYLIDYEYIPNEDLVIQNFRQPNKKDTTLFIRELLKFDKDGDKLIQKTRTGGTGDTVSVLTYSYNIFGLSRIDGNQTDFLTTEFFYDSDSTLIKTVKTLRDEHFETNFFSTTTGLIDSTLNEWGDYYFYDYRTRNN